MPTPSRRYAPRRNGARTTPRWRSIWRSRPTIKGTSPPRATRWPPPSAWAPGRPELPLYQGLVALDQADDAAAARLLDRARALGGDDLEPVVSYYGGLAWSRAGDRSAAREALERVVANWPGTDWAEQAALALGRLGEAENDLFGFLRVGIERDDNVVLRGRGVRLPDEIGRDRDERLVWNGSLGSHLVEDGRDTIGAALAYSGNAHEDLDRFDTHFPSVIVWWDRVLASGWTSRVLGGAGYAWVDDAPFLLETRLGTSLHRELPRGARATLSTELYRHDFRFSNDDVFDGPGTPGAPCPGGATVLCGPPGIDESTARNRDGLGWIVALEGVQPLWAEAELFAGASYQRFDARGQEYSFSARSVSLGLQTPLAYGVELEVSARLTWRPYRNPTTFPEPDGLVAGQQYALRGTDRRERELRTDVALVRPLNETLTVETRWTYERNRSTASVFDTRRHVLGAYLTASFGS